MGDIIGWRGRFCLLMTIGPKPTTQLVDQRHPGIHLAPAMGRPGGLSCKGTGSQGRSPSRASNHQLGHRTQIAGVALQPGQQLLGACLLDGAGIELDHLVTAGL